MRKHYLLPKKGREDESLLALLKKGIERNEEASRTRV
jgi:hypothetical protein